MSYSIIFSTFLIFFVAALYSSVGHAGASGYLAIMALFGYAPAVMKPTALVMNIFVATMGSWRFYRAKQFSWKIFWPFAITSIPCSFVGGAITLPGFEYKKIVAVILLYAAYRLFRSNKVVEISNVRDCPLPVAMLIGAFIGLLSGLTGVGGGIFLSPILLLAGWADTRRTSGISVVFILVNSISGLLGHFSSIHSLPSEILWWLPAALIGGWIGSGYGSKKLATTSIRRALAIVLLLAVFKLALT